MRRVVVTGMGAVTPLGLNVEEFWTGLKEGKTAFGEITKFDTTEYKVHLAAEVKGFQGKDYMDFKAAKRMELFCQYAVAAAKEAMEQAGICMENEDPYRVGCSIGSGIGSLQTIEREHKKLLEKGPARVNPLMVPLMISNMAAGNVSIQFGLKGKSINVVTACASGTHCIGEAFPNYSGRRCRYHGGRRYRSQHYTGGNCRIFCSYRPFYFRKSEKMFHSF